MEPNLLTLLSPKNIILFFLVVTRFSGMIASAPLFSTYPIPAQVKALIIILTSFITYPILMHSTNFTMPTEMVTLTIMLLKEFIVGMLIGFCANMLFVGIQMAGDLLSIQMGVAMSNVLDPVTQQQTPVIGQIYVFMATMIFIMLNGHQWLFASIFESYRAIPPGVDFQLSGQLIQQIIYFTSQMFTIAFGVIMPIYGVLFTLDILLGFVSKMMPQMNVYMVAIPFKIYIGLILMLIFITPTSLYMNDLIRNFLNNIMVMFT